MQTGKVIQLERSRRQATETYGYSDPRQLLCKRMERWLRLQQFVYGLPDDFSYSVRTRERNGVVDCYTLVKAGWMTWYGHGRAVDGQQALALALKETGAALSAGFYRILFHRFTLRMRSLWAQLRGRGTRVAEAGAESAELLAG